jgi:hypothetical protein
LIKASVTQGVTGVVVARDLTDVHNVGGFNLVVVNNLTVGVDFWSPHLQCPILI